MNSGLSLQSEWREQWAHELAQPLARERAGDAMSVLVFRLADEWFSVNSSSVVEISRVPAVHRLPHRRAGLVNVRGRVAVCADLGDHLSPLGARTTSENRLVVLRHDDWIFGTVVDAIDGVHRVALADLAPPPPPAAADRFTLDLWTLAERSIARIDEPRLFRAVREALA
jgi:chemotaxis-related protein WspD